MLKKLQEASPHINHQCAVNSVAKEQAKHAHHQNKTVRRSYAVDSSVFRPGTTDPMERVAAVR
jgi:hypothetical protein